MHHIYQTEGIVVSGNNFGEANRFIYIFTKDLGMIAGSAQGIRHLKSKLRYSLQDFSYVDVSLVKGKNIWRIINASHKENVLKSLHSSRRAAQVFAHGLALSNRLIAGEEKNENLFNLLWSSFSFLKENPDLTENELKNFESTLVLRILSLLGYWGGKPEYREFTESFLWKQELLVKMDAVRPAALRHINEALRATQL